MIILEGPDGAGKTTLARYLCQKHGLEYVHTDKPAPGEDVFRSYQRQLLRAKGRSVLFDRLFHGEMVYGPVCRGHSKLSLYQLCYLELMAADATVIWCAASPNKLRDRGDPIYKTVDPHQLLERYAYAAESSRLRRFMYDSTHQLPTDVVLPELNQLPLPAGHWVGGREAKTILVGERFPGKLPHYTSPRWKDGDLSLHRPFDQSRSGEYLFKALTLTNYLPPHLRLTNAIKEHIDCLSGRAELRGECAGLKVVALGNDAEAELKRAGVRVDDKVPHPQWWSRFRHDQLQAYAEVLGAAIL